MPSCTYYLWALAAVVASAFTAPAVEAQTADAIRGRNLAAACASCHGNAANSVGGMPVLAGMSSGIMSKKMRDFRSGAVPATIMQQIANGYSDRQLDLIAAFYAAQIARDSAGAAGAPQENRP